MLGLWPVLSVNTYNMNSPVKAIVHIDGDSFFTSCEQAINPRLQGKPVVVGADRGIATAFSYEAKKMGVRRGMTKSEILQICPEAILLPGDYETYTLFSKRMFDIMRRFTDQVEEYSIDEGFMDITDLAKTEKMSHEQIARLIKKTIQAELNLTVSAGLAPTKVLAKLASTNSKPNGFGIITQKDLPEYLRDFAVDTIWGVGRNTADYMRQLSVFTAYDFAVKPIGFIKDNFTKPHQDIWYELNGHSVYAVISETKQTYASISKTHTFKAKKGDRALVYAELVKNIENACTKARNYDLVANKVSIFLKSSLFQYQALEVTLGRATAYPVDILAAIKPLFDELYSSETIYRATGISLFELHDACSIQSNLFEPVQKISALKSVYEAVDKLAIKFGKHTVHSASALQAAMSNKKPMALPLISMGFVR